MRLTSLKFERFRNIGVAEMAPSSRATVLVGENGQGKTNLLEGIYYLSTLKPLRASRLTELIQFEERKAQVSGGFELGGALREVSVCLERTESGRAHRQALVDGKKAPSLEDYFGGVSVVAFTPDDLAVIKLGPDRRRDFVDRAVFNRFPGFLKESRAYLKALKSRNRLLKERAPQSYLEVYDETLAKWGARIWVRRRTILGEIEPLASRAFDDIGRAKLRSRFGYAPSKISDELRNEFQQMTEDALEAVLLETLRVRWREDVERGHTSVGPHVDDLDIGLDAHKAKQFASQGQQRALILSWKVGEIENLSRANGFLPLLLLDDVSSELDPTRNAYLMAYLQKSGGQAFLSTTDRRLVEAATEQDTVWYHVSAGCFEPQAKSARATRPTAA